MYLIMVHLFVENSRLDPNDPRNAKLLQLLDSIPNSDEEANYFQIVDVEDVQKYSSEDHFLMNKRFTMLCMRDRGVSSNYVNECIHHLKSYC